MNLDIPVDNLEPNKFNPNVLTGDDYENLKKSMKRIGPEDIYRYPIVSPRNIFYKDLEANVDTGDPTIDSSIEQRYVIIDGEHRWRIATELGWSTIRCDVREVNEENARRMAYQLNRLRGSIDPWKEAEFFRWETDRGKKQKQIADIYSVDRTTVSKRLSLLNITQETTEILKNVPRGTLTASHFEAMAPLHVEDQAELADRVRRIVKSRPVTVDEVQSMATRYREERKAAEALAAALDKSEHKTCPVRDCKGAAERISTRYEARGLPWVQCSSRHVWNLETGERHLTWYEKDEIRRREERKKARAKSTNPRIPSTVRSKLTLEEYSRGFSNWIRKIVPTFTEIDQIAVTGMYRGAAMHIDVDLYENSLMLEVRRAGKTQRVHFERKQYKQSDHVTKLHHFYPDLSKAPSQSSRIESMIELSGETDLPLFVSIEPILRFSETFIDDLESINYNGYLWGVAVGYDNYDNHLEEPRIEETLELISALRKFPMDPEVFTKSIRKA